MLPDLLPLSPYLRETIWGGRGLATHYNKPLPDNAPIGESWEVSAYKDMESIVTSGPLEGQNLRDLAQTHGVELLGQNVVDRYGTEFPMLIKLLDARQDLSIQVHPNDTYTRAENLGTYGKMEAWYILKSDNGRVAYGLKDGIDKHSFELAIKENRVGDAIRFFNVHEGDVVFVPPGTVHALCENVMIYEVQQSSDLTFRIYDYNRPGSDGQPRELHIDRSLDVLNFGEHTPEPKHWTELPDATPEHTLLAKSEHFQFERFNPKNEIEHTYPAFATLTILSGRANLKGSDETFTVQAGDTFFITANRTVMISPQNEVEYLISTIP